MVDEFSKLTEPADVVLVEKITEMDAKPTIQNGNNSTNKNGSCKTDQMRKEIQDTDSTQMEQFKPGEMENTLKADGTQIQTPALSRSTTTLVNGN
jgi:adenine deaminase